VDGTVIELTDDQIVIRASGEDITISRAYVHEKVDVGQAVRTDIREIIEGTCTPVIYSVRKRTD